MQTVAVARSVLKSVGGVRVVDVQVGSVERVDVVVVHSAVVGVQMHGLANVGARASGD